MTRKKLLQTAFVFLIISSVFMAMFFAYLSNTPYAHGAIRVACVGDSITHGSGYPSKLQFLLGNSYRVANFGVNGAGASKNSSKPYLQQSEFPRAQNFDPDVVIIMLGTNDAKANNTQDLDSFQASYEELIREFEALPGDQQIFIVDPPPILNNTLNLSNETLVQEVIPQINQVANDLNLPIVNVYSVLSNHTEVFGDGVHPNSEGGQLIASQIYQALTSVEQQYSPPPSPSSTDSSTALDG
jgi:lysophospholipase L1-like esterase